MFFYIYFDPEVIRDAKTDGIYALQRLEDILKGFVINCSLISFPNQLDELKTLVMEIPECFEVKEIKSLLSWLNKNHRFVTCLIPDYLGKKSDIDCLQDQYKNIEFDIILLGIGNIEEFDWEIETASIETYNKSIFEKTRYEFTKSGKAFSDDEYDENDFINLFLKKLLLYAEHIEICDYSLGKNVREDYIYSWNKLIHWLVSNNKSIQNLSMTIHSDKGSEGTARYLINELKSNIPSLVKPLDIKLKFYITQNSSAALPHERFLFTDQFAINFGRGLDFIKKTNHRNRNTTFSYFNAKDVRNIVGLCNHLLDSPAEIQIC